MSQDCTILDAWADALAERVADKLWARLAQEKPNVRQEDANLLRGWKAIAECLGVSERKAKSMRQELNDALVQPVKGGAVSADRKELINLYKTIEK